MKLGAVGEAMTTMETSKERWFEAEVNRIAGEIALKSRPPDMAKSKSLFRARSDDCAPTASQVLGTPRRHEPRASLARPGLSKRANCLLRFTGGSRKGSTRAI